MINLKIFDRKFDRGLEGDRPGPKLPLYLELRKKNAFTKMVNAKNSYNFTSKVIAIVFLTGLCGAITGDFSKT